MSLKTFAEAKPQHLKCVFVPTYQQYRVDWHPLKASLSRRWSEFANFTPVLCTIMVMVTRGVFLCYSATQWYKLAITKSVLDFGHPRFHFLLFWPKAFSVGDSPFEPQYHRLIIQKQEFITSRNNSSPSGEESASTARWTRSFLWRRIQIQSFCVCMLVLKIVIGRWIVSLLHLLW